VTGVPVPLAKLDGRDSLLSIVQMPAGLRVATVSIGGCNVGFRAVRISAREICSCGPKSRSFRFQEELAQTVLEKDAELRDRQLGG
jgi:5-(carboxyamino)imidazole ribonucleotide mutase